MRTVARNAPAMGNRDPPSLCLIIHWADRLRRVPEGRIVRINQYLRQ
jgi:hypothetical protein